MIIAIFTMTPQRVKLATTGSFVTTSVARDVWTGTVTTAQDTAPVFLGGPLALVQVRTFFSLLCVFLLIACQMRVHLLRCHRPDGRSVRNLHRERETWVSNFVSTSRDRLVGLVVKASASRAADPGFGSRLRQDLSGSSHTSDLKIGTQVATLHRRLALKCQLSAGTG